MSDFPAIEFYVEGEPVPKQSFRVVNDRKGATHGYTDPRVSAWQGQIAWAATAAMHGREPTKGGVSLELIFNLGNNRRVDLDNLTKCVKDGLKGILFADDSQVMHLVASKHPKESRPGVVIFCEGL